MRTNRIARDPEGRTFYVDGCTTCAPVVATATQTSSSLQPEEIATLIAVVAIGAIIIRYFMHREESHA